MISGESYSAYWRADRVLGDWDYTVRGHGGGKQLAYISNDNTINTEFIDIEQWQGAWDHW